MPKKYIVEFTQALESVQRLPANNLPSQEVEVHTVVYSDVDLSEVPELIEQIIGRFISNISEPKTGEEALELFNQLRERFGGRQQWGGEH